MTIGRSASVRFIAVMAGVALLAGLSTLAHAQASTTAKKPATAAKRTTPASTAAPAQSVYWSVNTDIGSEYGRTITRRNDEVPQAGVPRTRVPLEGGEGTVGLTTTQNIRATRFSDGRPVPGLERGGQQSEGYVGLSVSVPNIHKTLPFLSPDQPTWNRP
jgi:hypothetical protein